MYDEVLAPILSACCAGIFLFGVQTLQTVTYYHRGYKDPLYLRLTVLLMWLLELAHNIIIFVLVYKCLITYFGDSQGLVKSQRFLSINGTLAVLIAAVAQSYSGWRLYQLQDVKSWIIPSICWISSLIRTAIYITAVAHKVNPRPFLQTKPWRVCVMLVGILSLVADLMTAFGLLVELWARRHNVPLRQSQALAMEAEYPLGQCPVAVIIDKIILICISTNLITCFGTAITMALLYGMPNMYWMPASYVCSRLFSICFISLVLQGRRLKDRLRSQGIPSHQAETEHIALRAVARSPSNEVRPSLLEAGLSQFPDHLAAETATVTTEEALNTAHAAQMKASLE